MKKIIIILIAAIVAITPLLGCSSEDKSNINFADTMVAYEIMSSADIYDGGIHVDEYPQWSCEKSNMFQDPLAEEVTAVEFEGREYSGKYWYSVVEPYNNYQSDYYEIPGGWYSINAENGKLLSLVLPNSEKGEKTIDDCKDKAISIAELFIDVEKYKLTTTEGEYVNAYYFRRFFEGYGTCALLAVGIGTDGSLVTFGRMMTDEMEQLLSEKDEEQIRKTLDKLCSEDGASVVEKKVRTIYDAIADYEVIDRTMTILDDGSIGVVYSVDVNFNDKADGEKEGEGITGSRIDILLKC